MADTNGRLARFLWGFVATVIIVFGSIGFGVGFLFGRACP